MSRVYWEYDVGVKHPSMRGLEWFVKGTLTEPIEVRKSKRNPAIHLFYGKFDERLRCCVVVKFSHLVDFKTARPSFGIRVRFSLGKEQKGH